MEMREKSVKGGGLAGGSGRLGRGGAVGWVEGGWW